MSYGSGGQDAESVAVADVDGDGKFGSKAPLIFLYGPPDRLPRYMLYPRICLRVFFARHRRMLTFAVTD